MLYNLLDITRQWLIDHGLYPYVMVLDQLHFRVVFSGLLSFAVVLALGRPVIRKLTAMKIGDAASFDVAALNEALSSKANTPTMGGVLIAGAIAFSTLLLGDLQNRFIHLALAVLVWHAVLGGFDDWLKLTAASRPGGSRQGLYAWEKLVFQLGIGVLIGYFAFHAVETGLESDQGASTRLAHVLNLPFQRTFEPGGGLNAHLLYLGPFGYIAVMVLMMAGMSNAVNITDGLDGLASGISAAVSIGLVGLCLIAGSDILAIDLLVPNVPTADELAIVASAMAGACFGFLWWNCSPAAVFMGDTGSLCLGGLLAFVAVVIRQEVLLLIMSGMFLIEIGSVVLQVGYFKLTKGKRIFRCAPYHWHLHMGGWPEQKIVTRFWILTAVLIALAAVSIKIR